MNHIVKQKMMKICDEKISQKGEGVGLSFYAFFENKNTDPETLQEVATWWITEKRFDHFEKALKIRNLIQETL
ncbi:hypothetical protein KBB25_02315 [Candidatus Gracilibacteria bacterium]|nr:hypothetical protein [Candidatus Gracilibacteria bacterium]